MAAKVSVCIPVYGVEKYIERCARSLFEQTMRDGIEFVFVNDCTPDKSIEILEQVLSEYPHRKEQTKIVHHESNKGLVGARNTGLTHAVGEYIIHCDSDDWVELDMYEKMYNAAKENDADMVYCDYMREGNGSSTQCAGGNSSIAEDLQKEMLNRQSLGHLWNRLYRKHIAQEICFDFCPDHICFGEDLLRNMFMLNHSNRIIKISKYFYHYRRNQNSIVNSRKKYLALNAWETQQIFEKHFTAPDYREALMHHFCWTLRFTMPFGVPPPKNYRKIFWYMLKDRNFSVNAKILFFIACINYSLASILYKRKKGIS